ncbi:PKD domain-containing protein [Geminicoccus harenae]|uniref:PKD domain-containing protein n=1 Tax=Geminicoccus harenae TaxID=2498453 RepID=UPI00168AB484|nr:PKD domain-containing protein [Geminicoccus harenae]
MLGLAVSLPVMRLAKRVPPRVEAEFVGTPVTGEAPLEVAFTNLSSGQPTTWSWSFGDGGTSDQQHPVHTYAEPGAYTVSVTVSGTLGASNMTKPAYVVVVKPPPPPPPAAEFLAHPASGEWPHEVAFTDLSTGEPTSWAWDFGDGGTSTLQSPVHEYTVAGLYTVRLTATNDHGSDTETKADIILITDPPLPATPPVAGFIGSPRSGHRPLVVQFTDASTNTPTAWAWDFGDGGSSSAQSPEHTYTAAGTYTVELTATNADGSDTETKIGYVVVTDPPLVPPVADFIGNPRQGNAPLTVVFADASSRGPTAWSWAFGDGATSSDQNPTHTYAEPGDYSVALIATNADGADAAVKPGYITVLEPLAPATALLDENAQPILDEAGLPILDES